jgi:hypothetical protein
MLSEVQLKFLKLFSHNAFNIAQELLIDIILWLKYGLNFFLS